MTKYETKEMTKYETKDIIYQAMYNYYKTNDSFSVDHIKEYIAMLYNVNIKRKTIHNLINKLKKNNRTVKTYMNTFQINGAEVYKFKTIFSDEKLSCDCFINLLYNNKTIYKCNPKIDIKQSDINPKIENDDSKIDSTYFTYNITKLKNSKYLIRELYKFISDIIIKTEKGKWVDIDEIIKNILNNINIHNKLIQRCKSEFVISHSELLSLFFDEIFHDNNLTLSYTNIRLNPEYYSYINNLYESLNFDYDYQSFHHILIDSHKLKHINIFKLLFNKHEYVYNTYFSNKLDHTRVYKIYISFIYKLALIYHKFIELIDVDDEYCIELNNIFLKYKSDINEHFSSNRHFKYVQYLYSFISKLHKINTESIPEQINDQTKSVNNNNTTDLNSDNNKIVIKIKNLQLKLLI